jgi:hypothetical protein
MPHRVILTFWLLVAATLCADIVGAISLASIRSSTDYYYTLNVLSALVLAQTSIVAIWLVFRPRHDLWSWIVPPLVLVAVSHLRSKLGLFGGGWTALDYACRTALQMLLAVAVLWLLRRTALWRSWSPGAVHVKWEYSIRHLLVWTTVAAVMLALLARATWSKGQPISLSLTAGLFAPAAIAFGVVCMGASSLPWPARFAGYVLVGTAVALGLNALLSWDIKDRLLAEFVAEALLVAAWVEWGDIVPRTGALRAD